MKWTLRIFLLYFWVIGCSETLDVATYLKQVESKNETFQVAWDLEQDYLVQSREGSLYFSPRLISSISASIDNDPQFIPYFPIYLKKSKLINEEYKIGIQQQTPIGLDWELSSVSSFYELISPQSNISTGFSVFPSLSFNSTSLQTWDVTQSLSATQHLWKNGFGAKSRAKAKKIQHAALAQSFQERFKAKKGKAQAENVYWQLVVARFLKEIRRESTIQAQKLADYIELKKEQSLVLESEVYQALTILNSCKLEEQKAEEAVTACSLSFNSQRGVDSAIVEESLLALSPGLMDKMTPEERGMRADLKAQKELSASKEAENQEAIQELLPELNVKGFIGLQGSSPSFGDSWGSSFGNPALNGAIIVNFSYPLSPFKISAIKRAYRNHSYAVKMNLERLEFEHNQDWHRLRTRLEENKKLLEFLFKNSEMQMSKYENTQLEYERGLTTFFNVTAAKSDYQASKIAILQVYQTLIEIALNMGLYESD